MPILRPGPFARFAPPQFFLNDPDDWGNTPSTPPLATTPAPVNRSFWSGSEWRGRAALLTSPSVLLPSRKQLLTASMTGVLGFSLYEYEEWSGTAVTYAHFFYVSVRPIQLVLNYLISTYSDWSIGTISCSSRLEAQLQGILQPPIVDDEDTGTGFVISGGEGTTTIDLPPSATPFSVALVWSSSTTSPNKYAGHGGIMRIAEDV